MKTQNKRTIEYLGKQRQLLKKLRETRQFIENVGQKVYCIF